MMQSLRNLLRRFGSEDFQPATNADFTSCAPKSQRTKRGRGANGQAGVAARVLLDGKYMSLQEYERHLEEHGYRSNSPRTRMKEAIKWLNARGVPVASTWADSPSFKNRRKEKFKRWFVPTAALASAACNRARAELNGKGER